MSKALTEVLDTPAPAGVRLIARQYVEDWLQALPALHAGNEAEALHDYRVALRKLRSWLKTFDEGGKKAQDQLSKLQEKTGSARDFEVLDEWLKSEVSPAAAYVREQLEAQVSVDVDWVDARTHQTAERLTERLSRYSLEVPLQPGAAVTPFSWAYAAALRRLHHDLVQIALTAGSLEDAELLHKVRIRAKRLRYALTPLKEWAEVTECLRLLKERQDVLGELHDRHAFVETFEKLLAERPAPELAAGLDALMARARAEGHERFSKYVEHRHAHDVRLAALVDVVSERLGRRMGLHIEVVPA